MLEKATNSAHTSTRLSGLGAPFLMETDASSQAIGAVLSQEDNDGCRHLIEFYSSALSPSQRNYSAGELEAWAIVAALRKCRVYLQAACKVIIITDHNSLTWLRRQKDPRNKYARWIMELESYNYEILYRKGVENGAADFLSRTPCEFDSVVNDEEENFKRNIYSIGAAQMGERIRAEQLKDNCVRNAIEQLKAQSRIHSGPFRYQDGMRLSVEGLLYRKRAVIVPRDLKGEVTGTAHRLTHAGIDRTYEYMKDRFFWSGMRKSVEQYCNSCIICLENKRTNKRREPLRPIKLEVSEPRRLIGVDVATLPWDETGIDTCS